MCVVLVGMREWRLMGCVVLYGPVGESEWRLRGVRVVAVWLGGLSASNWLGRRLGRLAEYEFGVQF